MNFRSLLLVMTLLAPAAALAQSANANGNASTNPSGNNSATAAAPGTVGTDETDRLMQEYMARRAEWITVRKTALDEAAKAPNENARKAILKQLETDEKPSMAKMAEAGKAYSAAKKAMRADAKPRG